MAEIDVSDVAVHPGMAEDLDYPGIPAVDSHLKGDEPGPGIPGELAAIKRFMGLENRIQAQDENDLRRIMDHAKRQGIETNDELGVWLKKLKMQLGTPELGGSQIKNIMHYLDLDQRAESILREQQSYLR